MGDVPVSDAEIGMSMCRIMSEVGGSDLVGPAGVEST